MGGGPRKPVAPCPPQVAAFATGTAATQSAMPPYVPAGPTFCFLLGPCSSCSFRFRHQNQPATAAAVTSTTAVLVCPDDLDVVTAATLRR